jgi:predicted FMN-binding regulatory protein PaiB
MKGYSTEYASAIVLFLGAVLKYFEIEITELKNVFKLSQNRDEASHANIQAELKKGDAACLYMAAAMFRNKQG